MPSLKQLVEAVSAFMDEHPTDLITVVVDATFGHRIDPREAAEFDAAIEHNEIVAPPAGAVGRGDAFVLAIAHKVNATIISNDSYQEFHAEYDWLFDDGRLIGGKPVPHVGWVFVPRVPVRGPLSRKVTRDAKRKDRPERVAPPAKVSREASQPMPVPSAPPPGSRAPSRRRSGAAAAAPAVDLAVASPVAPAAPAPTAGRSTHVATPNKSAMVNDVLPFLAFVEHHPVGTVVDAVVESYASHGAYVTIGDARGYIPLRLMAEPAPRSAREVMKLGDTVTLHVAAFHAQRRGIDLATPEMAHAIEPLVIDDDAPAPRKRAKKAAVAATATPAPEASPPAAEKQGRKRAPARGKAAPVEAPPVVVPAAAPTPAPAAAKRAAKKATRPAAPATPAPVAVEAAPVVAAPPVRRGAKKAAAVVAPAPAPAPAPQPVKAAKPAKAAKAARAAKPAPAPAPAATPAKATRARVAKQSVPPAIATPAPAGTARRATKAAAAAPVAATKAVKATRAVKATKAAAPVVAVPAVAKPRKRAATKA